MMLAILYILLLLYVPGFFFFRSLRVEHLVAFICAPIASVAAVTFIPIIYYRLNIPCSAFSVSAGFLAFIIACLLVGQLPFFKKEPLLPYISFTPINLNRRKLPFTFTVLATYIIFGVIVCLFMFVGNLSSPEAFYSRYDNQTHLNLVQEFLDSGTWSTLHTGAFLSGQNNVHGELGGTSFYPAAWHDIVALACSFTGAKVTVASNALIAVLCGFCSPTGLFLLFCALFPQDKRLIALGAIPATGFATWPWTFIVKGPCLPNLLGFILLFAFLALFIMFLESNLLQKKVISFISVCLVSFFALGVAHPNTIFIAYVILAAYGGHFIWKKLATKKRPTHIIFLLLYTGAIVALWFTFYQMPFLQGVLSYRWGESKSLLHSIASLLSLNLVVSGPQFAMIVACLVGFIICLKQKHFWMFIPLAFFSLAYIASKSNIEPLKYYLASLWYQTPYRFSPCISVCLMPFAALGLNSICLWVAELFRKKNTSANIARTSQLITVAVFIAAVFTPLPALTVPVDGGRVVEPGFSFIEKRIDYIYSDNVEHIYSTDEIAFVNKALDIIPEGSLVLNQPNDGSVFAYGVNHLNTYFRRARAGSKTEDAKLIQSELYDYTNDEEVKRAVSNTGAHYLLQLDQGVAYEDGVWLTQYSKKASESWKGIDQITDDTPGFTVILSEGDMRLFLIDEAA